MALLDQNLSPNFLWSRSEIMDSLVEARFEQGRLLSLPSQFVHSFELEDHSQPSYADLVSRNTQFTTKTLQTWSNNKLPEALGEQYVLWWQQSFDVLDPVLRAGLAYLLLSDIPTLDSYLARFFCERALQEFELTPIRHYDVALLLRQESKRLTAATPQSSDLTNWLLTFLEIYLQAIRNAKAITETPRTRDLFWRKYMNLELNQRQKNLINLFLNAEIVEVSNSDYVRLFQTTRETAKRDLKKLRDLELLSSDSARGRSVKYRFHDA